MPEGDTIRYAAKRIGAALAGRTPEEILTPHPRHAVDRWPQRLAGRGITAVEPYGKHLFLRFEGGLALHSHLRMTGLWSIGERGMRWRRSPRRAWLVLRAAGREVVQFDGPVLELLAIARERLDPRLTGLGPDVLAEEGFDRAAFLRRLREDDPTRGIGDALLDQRTVAGIGNIWKTEACWEAGIDPGRATARVSDEGAAELIDRVRPRMRASAEHGHTAQRSRVYGRAGRPCPRCATPIRARRLGEGDRATYWCPACQR